MPPDSWRSLLTRSDMGETPPWLQRKRARLALDERDRMERFQQARTLEMSDDAGPTEYWLRLTADKMQYGRALARMGLEFSSIPAVCMEVERVFSGYVLPTRRSQFAPPALPYPSRIQFPRILQYANISSVAKIRSAIRAQKISLRPSSV